MKPILLIPGIGGSIIVHRHDKHRKVMSKQVIDNKWIHMTPHVRSSLERWKEDMHYKVDRNEEGKIIGFSEYENALMDVHDFGGTHGIKDIVPAFRMLPKFQQDILQDLFHFRYYGPLVEKLHWVGYKDRENLFGAPYDFRLVLDPSYRRNLFQQFNEITERAVKNTNKPLVVVTHSLGAILYKWFLSDMDPLWIDKHIDRLIFISPPFGGAILSMRAVLCGDHYLTYFHSLYKEVLSRNSGIIMCLPNEMAFHKDDVLVHTERDGIYSMNAYNVLASHGETGFEIWRDLYEPHIPSIRKHMPGVHMDIICSKPIETPYMYHAKTLDHYSEDTKNGNGDGIVSTPSLMAARSMFDQGLSDVIYVPESNHSNILSHPHTIAHIVECGLSTPKRFKKIVL